jgi:hypothetical protein
MLGNPLFAIQQCMLYDTRIACVFCKPISPSVNFSLFVTVRQCCLSGLCALGKRTVHSTRVLSMDAGGRCRQYLVLLVPGTVPVPGTRDTSTTVFLGILYPPNVHEFLAKGTCIREKLDIGRTKLRTTDILYRQFSGTFHEGLTSVTFLTRL